MYKILIADDESIVIDALSFIIEKNFPEQCMIETAQNGRLLVERAEELRPDIIFADIQMPGINGLGAMREIRRTNPEVIFFVVSAYSQFDYAQEALQLGATSYIMKPIEKERIVEELERAMRRIDEGKQKRRDELQTQEKLEIIVPIVETSLVYSMLSRDASRDEMKNYIALLGITEPCGNIMLVKFGATDNRGEGTGAIGASLQLPDQSDLLRGILRQYFNCIPGAVMGNMIPAFIPCGKMNEEEAYAYRVEQIEQARVLARRLQDELPYQVRIAFGGVKPILEAGESSRDALQVFTRDTDGRVSHADDLHLLGEYEDYPIDMETPLFHAVKDGDVTASLAAADRFFDWMEKNHGDALMDMRLKVLEFVMRIETIGYRATGISYSFLSRSGYMDEVLQCRNTGALRSWFREKIKETCKNITTRQAEGARDMIERAQAYIQENYKKDISLDEISQRSQVSPYYFSKIFKKKVGVTFVEYLTDVRMQRAKEFLRDTDLRMKEVSVEVGYADQNYFSRIFRRQFGLSPTEYRDQREV